MIESLFKLKANGSNIKTEAIGGATTFLTMAYIIIAIFCGDWKKISSVM